jgi:hypothetical protein
VTDIVKFDWSIVPRVESLAERVARTDFVPRGFRGRPDAVVATILAGAEIGLAPMQSLRFIHNIEGTPTLKPEAMRALILAAGHEFWLEEHTTTAVTVAGRRAGSDQVTRVTWTLDDAKRAGLAQKPSWQAHPRAMLLARATAELARAVFPDVIGGLSGPELDADTDGDGARRRAQRAARGAIAGSAPGPPVDAVADADVVVVETSEVFEPGSPASPMRVPEPASGPQLTKLAAMCGELGWTAEERRAFAGRIVGRRISSAKDLTRAEASDVIDQLAFEVVALEMHDAHADDETFDGDALHVDDWPDPGDGDGW